MGTRNPSGWAPFDQGAESRAQLAHPLGQLVEINTNILPLVLTLCFLTFGWHPLHHK
jgi:hypothetical protein